MKSKIWYIVSIALITIISVFFIKLIPQYNEKSNELVDANITILVPSTLAKPMAEISSLYTGKTNVTVTSSFDSSENLTAKIDKGEDGDIFISPHDDWIKALKKNGVIDVYSIQNLARDGIVIIKLKGKNNYLMPEVIELKDFESTLMRMKKVAIVSDKDILGKYLYTVVRNKNLTNNNIIIPTKDDEETISKIISENKEALGIILRSNAIAYSDKIDIVSSITIDNDMDPVNYQIAVIAGENMSQARNFINFTSESTVQNILKQYNLVIK